MIELKVKIIDCAMKLLNLLENCEDDTFVDEIVNSIYDNDVAPLWELEDKLRG